LFGTGDAVFSAGGAATHRSGIKGKWWGDGKPGAVHLSADRKQILNSAGTVHASRD